MTPALQNFSEANDALRLAGFTQSPDYVVNLLKRVHARVSELYINTPRGQLWPIHYLHAAGQIEAALRLYGYTFPRPEVAEHSNRFSCYYDVIGTPSQVMSFALGVFGSYHPAGYGTSIDDKAIDADGRARITMSHSRSCD